MAVSRIFRVRETMSLEVRGEAFNLTNSVRRTNSVVNFRSSFGGAGRFTIGEAPISSPYRAPLAPLGVPTE